ncbi:hypothetical protein IWW37_001993 [Coemansia sp. RSA 2050]|nr:hypothetical protein IWW37_001993 [Coemansia sp. RSA 2050]KAJ2735474.1 hypothetical protein IW152_001546 [Coemansia sp. BCRC 34962]
MDEDTQVCERKAIDLVRYALACHASGKPLKRENLKAHVLGNTPARNTRQLLDRANELLTQNFGLKMVALPSHEKVLTAAPKAQPAPAKWVLQSTLPDAARQRLDLPQSDDDQAILGFAATVLSLVFVSNMSVSVDQLVLYVRKLGPPQCIAPVDSRGASDAHLDSAAREAIAYLTRHGYLDKVKLGASETQATQQPTDGGDHHDDGMVYTWGPKAKIEFQPLDMARFIAAATGQECTEDFLRIIGRAYGSNIASQ